MRPFSVNRPTRRPPPLPRWPRRWPACRAARSPGASLPEDTSPIVVTLGEHGEVSTRSRTFIEQESAHGVRHPPPATPSVRVGAAPPEASRDSPPPVTIPSPPRKRKAGGWMVKLKLAAKLAVPVTAIPALLAVIGACSVRMPSTACRRPAPPPPRRRPSPPPPRRPEKSWRRLPRPRRRPARPRRRRPRARRRRWRRPALLVVHEGAGRFVVQRAELAAAGAEAAAQDGGNRAGFVQPARSPRGAAPRSAPSRRAAWLRRPRLSGRWRRWRAAASGAARPVRASDHAEWRGSDGKCPFFAASDRAERRGHEVLLGEHRIPLHLFRGAMVMVASDFDGLLDYEAGIIAHSSPRYGRARSRRASTSPCSGAPICVSSRRTPH